MSHIVPTARPESKRPWSILALELALVGSAFWLGTPRAATGEADDARWRDSLREAPVHMIPRWSASLDSARRSARILRNTLGTGSVGPTAGLLSLDSSVLTLLDDIGRSRLEEAGRSELLSLDREIASIESRIPPLARLVERERDRCLANVAAFEYRGRDRAPVEDAATDDDQPTTFVPDFHAHPGILRAQQAARDEKEASAATPDAEGATFRGHRQEIADAFRREAMPLWDEAIAIAGRPYPAAAADWERWNRKTRAFGLRRAPAATVEEFVSERAREMLGSAFPDLTDLLGRYTASLAHLRGARILLRLRARTIEQGRWPSSLREIEPGLPRDPFTGRPFRYRLSDDGVLLYSPGPDERDDGGDVIHDLVICTPRNAR